MLKWGEGMEPRFISWNAAALHTPLTSVSLIYGVRKKIKAIPSRKPEVSAGYCNDVCSPADDNSKLKWARRETVVMGEVARESRGGI